MRKIVTLLVLTLLVNETYAVEKEPLSNNENCCQSMLSEDKGLNGSSQNNGAFDNLTPKLLFSYLDFRFNSETSQFQQTFAAGPIVRKIYNRFFGTTKQYTAGADGVKLLNHITAGLSVIRLKTHLASFVSLLPGTPVGQFSLIDNNTLFGHVLTEFNSHFAIDVAAGYGRSNISNHTVIYPADVQVLPGFPSGSTYMGYYSNHSNNRLLGINAIGTQSWKKFLVRGTVGGLYNQVNSGYTVNVFLPIDAGVIPPQEILPLTNKVLLISETVEVAYKLTKFITPFVNGGLIQVAHYSNSRPTLSPAIISPLPQLEMNQDAYRVGAGVAFNQKRYSIRLEQKYYNSVGTFISNQSTIGIAFHPDV